MKTKSKIKIGFLSVLIASMLSGVSIEVHRGWNLLSTAGVDNVNTKDILKQMKATSILWTYEKDEWRVNTNDSYLKKIIESYNIPFVDHLNSDQGFWLMSIEEDKRIELWSDINNSDDNTSDINNTDIIDQITGRSRLKKSGQTISYDEYGNIVTNGSIKDDGYYQVGKAHLYTRDDTKEIVRDNVTGLEWQDNEDVLTVRKIWINAVEYCENLELGGYSDWFLPDIARLQSIVEYNSTQNVIDTSAFKYYMDRNFFSYTSYASDPDWKAWVVFFYNGITDRRYKRYDTHIRCVRASYALGTPSPRFVRVSGMIADRETNLIWQDDYSDNNDRVKYTTWRSAIEYCENLSLGGYDDWRLPNVNELLSLVKYNNQYAPATFQEFQKIKSNYYWTSTTYAREPKEAWTVSFYLGNTRNFNKRSENYYVRCVRGGI